MTCHQCRSTAKASRTYEQGLTPFQTHPRLDLFLSAKSPHPLNEVGCTICHRGSGEALDFLRTDHRASDTEAEGRGVDTTKYHWHKLHYWDYPMLASGNIESELCAVPHRLDGADRARGAEVVAEGYQLFERYGCYACHKVEWFPTKRQVPAPPSPRSSRRRPRTSSTRGSRTRRTSGRRPGCRSSSTSRTTPPTTRSSRSRSTARAVEMKGDEWSDTAIAAVCGVRLGPLRLETPAARDPGRGRCPARASEVFNVCRAASRATTSRPSPKKRSADVIRSSRRRSRTTRTSTARTCAASRPSSDARVAVRLDQATRRRTGPRRACPNLRLVGPGCRGHRRLHDFDDPGRVLHRRRPRGGTAKRRSTYKRDVLEEQARSFFNRTRRPGRARGATWTVSGPTTQELLARRRREVGARATAATRATRSPGLENAQPIGTELTNVGVQDRRQARLRLRAGHHRLRRAGLLPDLELVRVLQARSTSQYRENFLVQKLLDAPRSYDRREGQEPERSV